MFATASLLISLDPVSFPGMGKKNHRKTIRSLTQRIAEHESKIRLEYDQENPDEGLIRHWQSEIRAFEKALSSPVCCLERYFAESPALRWLQRLMANKKMGFT